MRPRYYPRHHLQINQPAMPAPHRNPPKSNHPNPDGTGFGIGRGKIRLLSIRWCSPYSLAFSVLLLLLRFVFLSVLTRRHGSLPKLPKKSAKVAEMALTTTAKATVFHSKIHAIAGLSQKAGMAVVDWTFFIVWENTGTTPTRHLHMHTNWKPFDSEMPADFDFPDLSNPPTIRPKIVIGPKSTTFSGECEIPIAVLVEASEKKKRVYLWGWVEYNDVFDATTRHRTECCIEIVVAGDPKVAHAPGDISSPNIPFLYHGGGQFNGMDDECYRQPKKYP
jgi:hypothetical protein